MSSDNQPGSGATCPQHPGTTAPYLCARCQTMVCGDCCYTMPDGSVCCKPCYNSDVAPEIPVPVPVATTPPSVRLAAHPPALEPTVRIATQTQQPGQGCVQHPNVKPVARCHLCGAASCRTCDFVFPGNLHFCPVCVTSASGTLSPRRKKYVIAAFILAGWSTLCFVLFLGGAMAGVMGKGPAADMVLGVALLLLTGLPSVIGTALGMSAKRPGGPNPVSVWITLFWNALVLGGLVAMTVVGNLMK